MSEILTKRLRLRRFQMSDLSHLIELESDPEVMKFTPHRQPLSAERIEMRLKSLVEQEKARSPMGVWAAETQERKEFVGWFMLMNTQREYPELGFMILRRQWGNGYATEAAKALVDFGLETLNQSAIAATVDEHNISSKRILQKLGFRYQKAVSLQDAVLGRETVLNFYELQKSSAKK